jgi:hypothetical protein
MSKRFAREKNEKSAVLKLIKYNKSRFSTWIRIRILNMDPDSANQFNEDSSVSASLQVFLWRLAYAVFSSSVCVRLLLPIQRRHFISSAY